MTFASTYGAGFGASGSGFPVHLNSHGVLSGLSVGTHNIQYYMLFNSTNSGYNFSMLANSLSGENYYQIIVQIFGPP